MDLPQAGLIPPIPHLHIFDCFVKEFTVYDYCGNVIFTKDDLNGTVLKYEDIFEWHSIIEITSEIADMGKKKYSDFPKFDGEVINEPPDFISYYEHKFFRRRFVF
jgi:hypothetical protein